MSTCNSPAPAWPRRPEITTQRSKEMSAISPEAVLPRQRVTKNPLAPLATLAVRRFQLSTRTPRELVVPLLTPIMFALVIAPALKQALHTGSGYEAFVATGTVGLLIPLNTMFAGLGVIVDRESGAQRELLAAPIPRALLVLGNLAVASAITALQIAVLIAVGIARGIHFDASGTGIVWFVAGATLFTVGMYGAAETLPGPAPRPGGTSPPAPQSASWHGFLPASPFPSGPRPAFLRGSARS